MLTQRQRTILIVDDLQQNRERYRCYLTADSDITYTILEAKSANDTLALCDALASHSKAHILDGILLKYCLSDGDGLEVLATLKTQLGETCPPVVIIDGDNTALAVRAIKGGAEDYLIQDQATPEQLRCVMKSAIENAELRRALHQSEVRFRTSVENMLDCFGIYSAIRNEAGAIIDFRVEYVNAAACEANQMTKEQQLGKGLCEILPAHRESGLFEEYCRVVETGKPLVKESLSYSDVYGQQRLVRAFDLRVTKLEDGFVAAWRDITQTKQAEEALRESERRFHAIFNSTFQFIGLLSVDGILIEANQTALDFGGLTQADVIGRPFWEARWWTISPQTQAQLQAAIAQAAKGEFVRYEVEVLGAGDRIVTIDFSLKPVRNESGQVILLIPEGRDITEHARVEAERHQLQAVLETANQELEQRVAERTAELQRAYADLAEQEATLRASDATVRQQLDEIEALYATAPIGLCFIDTDLRFVRINEHLAAINGVPAAEHIGRTLRDIVPEMAEELEPLLRQVIESGEPILNLEVHGTNRAQPGVERDWVVNYYPLKREDGQVLGVNAMVQEITERKQAEAALRENKQFIQRIADTSPGILYLYDLVEQRNLYVNCSTGELLGYTPEQILEMGRSFTQQTMHPDDFARLPAHIAQLNALRSGETLVFEYRMRHADGSWRWFWSQDAVFHRGTDGSLHQILGTAIDISDRKQAESDLRQSEAQLQQQLAEIESIYHSAPIGLNVIDTDLRFVRINEQLAEINGFSVEEHIGRTVRELLPHLADKVEPLLRRVLAGEPLLNVEITGETPAQPGVQRTWLEHFLPLKIGEQIIGINTVCEEITDRKRVEEALRESEINVRARAEELQRLMEITPVCLWIADDPNCHHIRANQTAYNFMGTPPGSITTATPPDGSYPLPFKQLRNGQEVLPHDLPMQKAARTGQEIDDELEFVFEDGTSKFIYGKAVPLFNETGEVRGVVAAFVDVTERKRVEREREQLLLREQAAREQAERANRIKDEFLAVLSHELRTPLNPILGWAKLLKSGRLNAAKTAEALNIIERNAKLQVNLIEDLLDVSRILRGKLTLNISTVNLADTISAALETVRLAAQTKEIQIQTTLEPNVGQVAGDPARLQQIVWNLLSNAVKFTPTGGRVEVRLLRVESYAQITVSDTGKGISPDFLPHIFEYFCQEDSTTTRKFGGLGLGLAIVRNLVELHGGTIEANSPGIGQGATFIARLPLMTPRPETSFDNQGQDVSLDLSGIKVLIVDDDADSRDFVTFVLELYGAQITKAASALEALQVLAQSKPDILISDIGMPQMDGYELLRQIRTWTPDHGGEIPAIALTAYAGEFDQRQAFAAGFQMHVSKPVEPDALATAVARLARES
jgi:PAS domain S-box-containing protein